MYSRTNICSNDVFLITLLYCHLAVPSHEPAESLASVPLPPVSTDLCLRCPLFMWLFWGVKFCCRILRILYQDGWEERRWWTCHWV